MGSAIRNLLPKRRYGVPVSVTLVLLSLAFGVSDRYGGLPMFLGDNSVMDSRVGGSGEGGRVAPPKVALLFLTRGSLPLEPIWRDFLEASPIPWESMFRLYVHRSDHKKRKEGIFTGKEVPKTVSVQWGNHSMIDAERALFEEAFRDDSVQTFVMLSEDSIPLYSAILVYMQLSLETTSRINSCVNENNPNDANERMDYRWVPEMASAGITKELWRKSSQWVALKRKHVEIVLKDVEVDASFSKECYVAPERFCVSDEHYIPSLFALKNISSECACNGVSVNTRWTPGAAHPKVFGQEDAIETVIEDELRDGWNPDADCGSIISGFANDWVQGKIDVKNSHHDSAEDAAWNVLLHDADSHLMSPACPLFARKIDSESMTSWKTALEPYIW